MGEDREIGFTQGSSLGRKIVELRQKMRELEPFRAAQPKWLPYPAFLSYAEWKSKRALCPALRDSAGGMLDRLEGISTGAQCPLGSICLMNAMEAFLGSCDKRTVSAPLGGCSALAIRGSRSASGKPIVAKNFDYIPLVQPFYILRETRPHNGFRSLDFAVAPQAGTIDGINERGLCITLNYAFLFDSGQPAPLITMLIAQALAQCSSVGEAIAHIERHPRWGTGILMLADAEGDIASLELSPSKAAVRRPGPGEDWLSFTNVCRTPEICAIQVPETAVFCGKVPDSLQGEPVLQPHLNRARRIDELVQAYASLDLKDMAKIMADHGPNGQPNDSSPCVHAQYWRTTASFQWLPSKRGVRAWYGSACTAAFAEFAL